MKWLTDFVHMPMLWDVIIPVIALLLFALLLLWDSRLPPERKILRKLLRKPK